MEQSIQVPFYRSEKFRIFSKKVEQLTETVHTQQQVIDNLTRWLELLKNEVAWIRLTLAREKVREEKANNPIDKFEEVPVVIPKGRKTQKKKHKEKMKNKNI